MYFFITLCGEAQFNVKDQRRRWMGDCVVCNAFHIAVNVPFGSVKLFYDKKMVYVWRPDC